MIRIRIFSVTWNVRRVNNRESETKPRYPASPLRNKQWVYPRAQEKESQCFQKMDRKQWPGFKGQLCSINHPELALEPRSIQSQWVVADARVPQNIASNLQHQHHVRACWVPRNLGLIPESPFWPDPRESVGPLRVRSSASYYATRKGRKWTLTKKPCILLRA